MNKIVIIGSSIASSGAMESRKFVEKDGNTRIAGSLHADEVNFCGSKSENNGGSQKPSIDEGYSGDPVESDDDVLF